MVFSDCGRQPAVRHEACNGLYKLSLSGLEGGDSINRSFLLLAASTLLKFLPDAQALKPLRVGEGPSLVVSAGFTLSVCLSVCLTHTHTHLFLVNRSVWTLGQIRGGACVRSLTAVCVCRWRTTRRSLC